MASLTHADARARADLVEVTSVHVDLDLDPTQPVFGSTTTIRFTARTPGESTWVDLAPVSLVAATLNDVELDPATFDTDGRRLPLPGLAAENVLVVSGLMGWSNDGEGLHLHQDPADDAYYAYAMSFLDAGPRWFASFDQPDLKAPYTMSVRVPLDWKVLGNGEFTCTEPGRWEMAPTPPLSTYFATLVAGPYASVTAVHDGIPLGIHARQSLRAELERDADDILEVTRRCFDAYHDMFDVRYAFGSYHQVFVPDFNAGAMENPGCVTFRDQFLFRGASTRSERATRASTIAHEMAHQWFGDLVTMRWWDDLWLNESFAELMGQWVASDRTDYDLWVDFGINRKDWGAVADQGPSTHPVAGNGSEDAESALAQFDGISYAKGAGILRQLVAYIGQDSFILGLRDYFERHAFGNAEFADLVAAWERASGRDLGEWTDAWLGSVGMDILRVVRDGDRNVVVRESPDDQRRGDQADVEERATGSRRTHVITVAAYDINGRETATQEVEVADEPVEVDLSGVLLVPDAGDDTWARIRPDHVPFDWPSIDVVTDPLARVVLWNSVRDQVRSTEVDPDLVLTMLETHLDDEPDDVILRAMLSWARAELIGPYTPPMVRPQRTERLALLAGRVLDDAEPGSDRQLTAWRTLIGTSHDEDQLRGWLTGDGVPSGRELDSEMAWSVVERLAALTGDRELVERQFAGDRSASGRNHRARALAAIPEPEAKETAFDLLMGPSEASAYELYATADGLFLPEQVELTERFVEPFFAKVNSTASFRRGWALARLVLQAFPLSVTSQRTLDLVGETLAKPDLDPSVRRSLTDAAEVLRRAVESQRRYAGEAWHDGA
ncbi:aminopeptidase N [Mariniluteicoccus endophyticus]